MSLEREAYSVYESDGQVEVCAKLVSGVLDQEIVVTLIISPDTAVGECVYTCAPKSY